MIGIRRLFRLIQEGEDPVAGGRSRLHDGSKVRCLGDGLVELAHILDKGLNLAYGKAGTDGHQRAGYGDAHIPQVAEEIDQRHQQARNELAFPAKFIQLIVDFIKGSGCLLFMVKGLHYQMP